MENEKKDNIVDLAANLVMRAEEFDEVLVICTKKDGNRIALRKMEQEQK